MRTWFLFAAASVTAVLSATVWPATSGEVRVIATQQPSDPTTPLIAETSGLAIAGIRDEQGRPLLWAHDENHANLLLFTTTNSGRIYRGHVVYMGGAPHDAEDIASVRSPLGTTIYLADTGANDKRRHACVHLQRSTTNPGLCTIDQADRYKVKGHKKHDARSADCLARGKDWLWLSQLDVERKHPPALWRIAEPSLKDADQGTVTKNYSVLPFKYPVMCGNARCLAGGDRAESTTADAFNTEALAVILEPDGTHTAYLFTKAYYSLDYIMRQQRPDAAICRQPSDGESYVFRFPRIDQASPNAYMMAEYVTTLSFSPESATPSLPPDRVTAADFIRLDGQRGLLAVKTKSTAYKWPVLLRDGKFDIADSLKNQSALKMQAADYADVIDHADDALTPWIKERQEAVALLNASQSYQMGECKEIPYCRLFLASDRYTYVPGDVDGNGAVDARDSELLREIVKDKSRVLFCDAAADVNADGVIDQQDLASLEKLPITKSKGTSPLSCGFYSGKIRYP